jgi:hypothetical protein
MTTRGGIQRRRRLGGGGIQPQGRREDKDVAASRQRRGVEIPPLWQCEGQWRIYDLSLWYAALKMSYTIR